MKITVREATREEGDRILDLWNGFTDHLSEFNNRYQAREDADDHWLSYFKNQVVDSQYSAILLAENNSSKSVGTLEIRIVGEHPIFQLDRHAEIQGVFVREEARNEGVGEALLEAAVEWMRQDPRNVEFYRVDVIEGDEVAKQVFDEIGLEPVKQTYEGTV